MTREEAAELQRAYVRRRRAWYRRIGWPVKGHEAEPDPGAIPLADDEEG